jgi:hypothetical protein
MDSKSDFLTEEAISGLFERFSHPMVRPCITESQKQKAVAISKILWLRLITGTDTDEVIYSDLERILGPKHDGIVALGSMYVFKMKAALTTKEVRRLRKHYRDEQNFNRLQDWQP